MLDFEVYHDSHRSFYRHPFGAVPVGSEVVLRIKIISQEPPDQCILRIWRHDDHYQEISMVGQEDSGRINEHSRFYTARYQVPEKPGLLWYSFRLHRGDQVYYYGNNQEKLGGEGVLSKIESPTYQITVFKPQQVPAWYKEGVMYQIFVDRFHKGTDDGAISDIRESIALKQALFHLDWQDTPFYLRDEQGRITRWTFFGGNLTGVLEKLDYLESLGVSIIYFNPIFEASSNHKYDTADYMKIDGMFGDEKIFRRLVEEAKKRGIAIILDGVFSHTGANSIYFDKYGYFNGRGAFQSSDSPYASWYSIGEDRTYDCWWGVEDLPNVNEMEPSYQEFIFGGQDSVVRHWLKMGVKGWRLDVVDELPDEFVKKLRQVVKATDPEAVLIGEVWEDASNKVSYGKLREYFGGEELDGVMNYPLRSIFLSYLLGRIEASQVHDRVMNLYENYPRENFLAAMNIIGSHDRRRALTILGESPEEEELSPREKELYRLPPAKKALGIKRLKVISLLQMTFPGVPCIYYGDEAGMEGYADPYNRGPYPWGREDEELLSWYRRLIRMRREYRVFREGNFSSLYQGEDVYGYSLQGEGEKVFVLVNRHLFEERTIKFNLRERVKEETQLLVLDLLSGKNLDQNEEIFVIPPLSGRVIYSKELPQERSEELMLPVGCGVLLHITSLPSPWRMGDFGQESYRFADFLSAAGHTIWQVLPLHPPGSGHSPYQCFSAFAGNEFLIDTGHLIEEGLLKPEEVAEELEKINETPGNPFRVNFSEAKDSKRRLFRKAWRRFKATQRRKRIRSLSSTYLLPENYERFQQQHRFWLEDYCLYATLKKLFKGEPWYLWKSEIRERQAEALSYYRKKLTRDIDYYRFLQYTFFTQWEELKSYCRRKGISILGDLPIYVAHDSADTWVNRQLFALDEAGQPLKMAGVPPDYFSHEGQLWGNPVYRWDKMAEEDYVWWRERIRHSINLYDYLRLDHFRGFEGYWAVPRGEKTAVSGHWYKGPGVEFFEVLRRDLGDLPFIVEDLGVITPEVHNLKHLCGFPGMWVYQFSHREMVEPKDREAEENSLRLDGGSESFQREIKDKVYQNIVYYTGTHDNDTLAGWCQDQGEDCSVPDIMEKIYQSEAAWVIVPMQDVLRLGKEHRMNIPGTAEGNWAWRLEPSFLTDEIKRWLGKLAAKR
jgi:4-alpha-glucanotransferase